MNKLNLFFLLLLFSSIRLQAQYAARFNNAIDYKSGYVTAINNFRVDPAIFLSGEKEEEHQLTSMPNYSYGFRAGSGFGKLFKAAMAEASGKKHLMDNQSLVSIQKKKKSHLQVSAVRKWNFRTVVGAVCDYLNKGLTAKYQPATLLIADTR